MATCLDCIEAEPKNEKKGPCFCKLTPNKIKRSTSLKESPHKGRKSSFSFSEKRSLSMSSLHRSRSVQKLDFSMDMSVDGSFHNQSQGTYKNYYICILYVIKKHCYFCVFIVFILPISSQQGLSQSLTLKTASVTFHSAYINFFHPSEIWQYSLISVLLALYRDKQHHQN